MARIAFILLCHKDAPGIIAQARRLTFSGDFVSIHFDASADPTTFAEIQTALADNPSVTFVKKRHKCGWGEWSLVAATLSAVRAAVDAFPTATHFYMLSGDCQPIKSAEYAHEFLDASECDYIEHNDFFKSNWIKTGLKEERLIYRYWFNERTQSRLYYASLAIQQKLKLTRKVPADIQVMIGSQWWCLRRQTIEKVLEFCDQRPDVLRFFSTTWIPDETFFQTIVPHVVPRTELRNRTLTYLVFTDYGMPVTFYNDQYDLLLRQDYLFARKISTEAIELRERLGTLWGAKGVHFSTSNEATGLFRFLTGRGRVGRRFAPRFWESDNQLGRDKTLLLIVSKKWHVAKRLTEGLRDKTSISAVDYLFNEQEARLPDMGGVESTVAKRDRHRSAVVKLLFDQLETKKLALCLDSSALPLIENFFEYKTDTRVLLIETDFDREYLRGHITRVGLAGRSPAPEVIERLLPTVRRDLEHEAERLRDMGFSQFYSISPKASVDDNAAALAKFLDETPETARELASIPYLFSD
ncbi:DUF5928 domain-containing protein [Paracoccus sp. (in: a-proteobacteria)]|uniref:DUF5928 domain-containing protein n=1 Tax=Paracoccus sp. TaxID=267 RepID=UPI00289DE074|nr:DUF5928 domain-containing protein [Paracoccus sp. (in: a-proteobacteria)]